MSESVYARQQARKRAEVWYGEWDATREAIIAARGARESSDVAAEFQPGPPVPSPEVLAGMRNMTREEYAKFSFYGTREALLGIPAPLAWLHGLIYGPPIDYSEDLVE